MSSASEVLRSFLDGLEIRQQVEQCVKEIVTDVECAHQLSSQLQHELERQAWEQQNKAQQQALYESYLERQQLKQECLPLADGLVRDLYKTSRELGKFYQLQTKHTALTNEYDELLAKLLQAEDQIRLLEEEKEQAFRNSSLQSTTPDSEAEEPKGAEKPAEEEESKEKSESKSIATEAATESKAPEEEKAEPVEPSTEAVATDEPTPVAEEEEAAPAAVTEEPVQASPAAVVSLENEAADSSDDIHIADFEDSILMNIFAFLDALEILNTAQINTKMYNRVDITSREISTNSVCKFKNRWVSAAWFLALPRYITGIPLFSSFPRIFFVVFNTPISPNCFISSALGMSFLKNSL